MRQVQKKDFGLPVRHAGQEGDWCVCSGVRPVVNGWTSAGSIVKQHGIRTAPGYENMDARGGQQLLLLILHVPLLRRRILRRYGGCTCPFKLRISYDIYPI